MGRWSSPAERDPSRGRDATLRAVAGKAPRLRTYIAAYRRCVPRSSANTVRTHGTAISEAMALLAPWDVHDYPGHHRTIEEILGVTIANTTLHGWKTGNRQMPLELMRQLAEAARLKAAAFAGYAAQLEREAQQLEDAPKHATGFRRLDSKGRDGRGNGARGSFEPGEG